MAGANNFNQYDLTNVKPEDFPRFCSQVVASLQQLVNGNLTFSNMRTQQVNVSFPVANTNVSVPHTLNKTGVKFIVVSQNIAGSIINGSGDTTSQIVLQASVSGITVSLLLF